MLLKLKNPTWSLLFSKKIFLYILKLLIESKAYLPSLLYLFLNPTWSLPFDGFDPLILDPYIHLIALKSREGRQTCMHIFFALYLMNNI